MEPTPHANDPFGDVLDTIEGKKPAAKSSDSASTEPGQTTPAPNAASPAAPPQTPGWYDWFINRVLLKIVIVLALAGVVGVVSSIASLARRTSKRRKP